MRTDATDRRPWRMNIGRVTFWLLVVTACSLPVLGFFVSVGWIAPNWLRFNMNSMKEAVAEAEATLQPLQQQNAQLAERKAALEQQVATMRSQLAEAETKATMAETARTEAATRLGQLEAEVVNLKQAVAKYEAMLKPKSAGQRELVQCNDLTAAVKAGKVNYSTSFSRARRDAKLPDKLTVQVRVAQGDNAMLLEQAKQNANVVNHTLEIAKSPKVQGSIALNANQTGGMRMLDLKVMDGSNQVGYCWKSF
ncbi:MAG: hypothetical protein INF43_03905 [Alphaproteobacteria bacterium]|jgi:chromosome segregation ATPase|nr:hypothetical protein [Alphaproteobacteria bacterium]